MFISAVKDLWMSSVQRKVAKKAVDPQAKVKLVAAIVLLLIIANHIPRAENSAIACGPCVTWAATFCAKSIAAGGACAAVATFPPASCACLLTTGGVACVAAAGTCAFVCVAPTV